MGKQMPVAIGNRQIKKCTSNMRITKRSPTAVYE